MKAAKLLLAAMMLKPTMALAFRAPDMSGDDTGAAAVYRFDETSGTTAFDSSGVGAPLDLTASTDGNLPTNDGTQILTNAFLTGGRLMINPKPNGSMPDQGYQSAQRHRSFMASGPATKLNACTNGFTIQAFVRPWFPFQGNNNPGNLIVGLSNSAGLTAVANPNWGLYQTGQSGSETVTLRVRSAANATVPVVSATGAFLSVRETEAPGQFTEVIATQESNGILTVYVNRIARSTLTAAGRLFDANARLVIGNELVPLTLNGDGSVNINNQRNWSGEIAHLAIYCRGYSRAEILGSTINNKAKAEVVRPNARGVMNPTRHDARKMVERLTGVVVPVDHPMVLKVEQRLAQGDRVGAAKIVTGDSAAGEPGHPDFLNTTMKLFAMKMSNREETIRAPLNDFAASFIGITRDERNAQELLTGDFFYMANPAKATVRSNMHKDLLLSNNHFEDLEKGQWDIGKVLMRVPSSEVPAGGPTGQMIALDTAGGMSPNPEPAGVITSRAFLSAHAIAGTNRRLVEYSFRAFMCVPMSEMADTSASPARIGRDIDRLPGGDATKFETSCKGCHTVMDGFRGAFAKYDFASITINNVGYNFVRHTDVSGRGTPMGFPNNMVDANGIVRKLNHNENTFPNGYVITDNSFVNNAVGTANKSLFGWGGSNKVGGIGVGQFGRMIADSTRFSQCMAKRAYEIVCAPGVPSEARVSPVVDALATKFRESGYKLRVLFQETAANSACAQGMGR